MKFFVLLIGVIFFGYAQPNAEFTKADTTESTVVVSVELNDGTVYSERLLASDTQNFDQKMVEKFGADAFCCCSFEFEGGGCYRRRNTCAEAQAAFCDCASQAGQQVIFCD